MMTVATVKIPEARDHSIDVDIDDSGWAYIKQNDDWIAFPVKYKQAIIAALEQVWVD